MSVQSVYELAPLTKLDAIEKDDLLILGASCSRIRVKAKPLERVMEQGFANGDFGFPILHSIVKGDDCLLRFRQLRMGPNLQRHLLVPVSVSL